MDSVFALAAVPRALVLERAAARVPGCLYLCLWAPVTAQLPSSHLFCLDAWIGGGGARARASFEAYRGALCAVVSGCVPGWAYREGRAYVELPEPDLTASASLQVQQQFYHEAGTKMAVFMGCESGEIEIGLSTTSVAAAAVADHVHQSFLEDLLQLPPTGLSSSSSPVPSLSIGSPEYSSLIRAMATPVAAAGEPSTRPPMMQASPLAGLLAPMAEADDYALMAQAMLAVTPSSGPPSTSTLPPPPCPPWLASHRSSPRRTTAFKPYRAALSPRARPRPGAPGQRMMKACISLLASVHTATRNRTELATARHEGSSAPSTTSQLHHVISERRRRERLNDSFQTLRALLPPGSKKDKANVLASTTEYMARLVSQVSQLREKNLQLEARLGLNQSPGFDPSGKTVEVEVTTGASTSTSATPGQQSREVSVRVTVRAECDMSDLLTPLLARLKDAGGFAVLSVEARQQSSALARASLTLRIAEAGDDAVDATRLEEALAKVVEDAVTKTPPPVPPPRSP
ncbi:hypothetical protein CFC21_098694 [Triticum aestivum]|uniref:BHLH domain-containing protein n=2 Tax=Triticum aestivum TaxID=4565 RepID=A0A3B6RM20_WHEAT|nr:putative transcription factor bHLH041 [Triticum dicoccoides]XP_044423326.1 putative transcription factor bHLH041 [Triticum aestivum]KAF7096797.1 hypothetical protein CFC21_098694 [Triticum aestivum]